MIEGFFCLATFCFLAWVLLLKTENAGLKQENQKLRAALDRLVKKTTANADVVPGRQSWGKSK